MSQETFAFELTEEERGRVRAFELEIQAAASKIEGMFPRDTRGMWVFMLAIRLWIERFPSITTTDLPRRAAEWIAMGEPEDLTGIIEKITERGRQDEARRQSATHWN
ncbi:MAG TPA: hypothetical protein VK638_33150 [Edaphobacter sp.]|nr:hypothetical protein [Edaphobacter sp.]